MTDNTRVPSNGEIRYVTKRSPVAALTGARLLAIGGFAVFTNFGFSQRIELLLNQGNFKTLIGFLAVWGLSLAAMVIAAFQPRLSVRLGWAALIALSTAVAWGYHHASQSELSVFDVISLWNARHEAGRAMDFYGWHMVLAAIVLVVGFVLLALPSPDYAHGVRRWLGRMALVPLIPILAVDGIVYAKSGGGSQSLPAQFVPVALTSLAAVKVSLEGVPARGSVTWQPQASANRQNLVYLVDESLRADYLDLTPGNRFTPHLAEIAATFTNFGPAVSGGNCSNYSNGLLRFAASREDIAGSVNTSPTLFQFAKKAGYRTVYIDAQAGNITNAGLLQNFMSVGEKQAIDGFYAIRDVPAEHADEKLAQIITDELARAKTGGPVFIYANKYGAHFPYDHAYPAEQTLFHPAMRELATDTQEGRIASYRNAIAWSVDRFLPALFKTADLSKATVIYTSDHGQVLDPSRLTHCQVEDADVRQGLVPLLTYSSDPATTEAFHKGAALLKGKSSHFQIAPALLSLMGYSAADIATRYDESLFLGTSRAPAFTTGDVFGLFGGAVHWNPIDLGKDYMEHSPKVASSTPAQG